MFLLLILLLSGCSGGGKKKEVGQYELYHEKRVDCEQTKNTNEAANVTQCVKIRPDAKWFYSNQIKKGADAPLCSI